MKWPPHNFQPVSPSFISLHAGFCFRSRCSPPLSGSNCIHESGTNSFYSYKAVLIFHCQSISYLKTSLESAFPIRKRQSVSIGFGANFDFKVLWYLLGSVFLWINILPPPLPPKIQAIFLFPAFTFVGVCHDSNCVTHFFSSDLIYSLNLCVAHWLFNFCFISNGFVPLLRFCKCTKVDCLWKYLP